MQTSKLIDAIMQSKTIALFSHIKADGDAVGSIMALYNFCKDNKKQVYVFLQDPVSANFNFLCVNKVANKSALRCYDLAIGLDCPNLERFGVYQNEFKKAKYSFNIDHHLDNQNFALFNIVNTKKSSTCEVLFDIFESNKLNITSQVATCLYCGIVSDTGRFIHSNTSSSAFYAAGKLIEYGANVETINYVLFSHKSYVEFDIFRTALSEIEFYENGKIAFVGITDNMLKKCNATTNDTFLIIDFVKGIEGVEIAVLMTESKSNEQMVSVRTNSYSAQNICTAFGGGGHLKASGCRIFVGFEQAKNQLIKVCKNELKND